MSEERWGRKVRFLSRGEVWGLGKLLFFLSSKVGQDYGKTVKDMVHLLCSPTCSPASCFRLLKTS